MSIPAPPVLDLERFAAALESPGLSFDSAYRARVVRVAAEQGDRLRALCRAHGIKRLDTIDRQLAELAAVRLPSGHETERSAFAAAAIELAGESVAVGNWVYLPWEGKLAHLLGADDYFDVITNRNANKITPAEQRVLRTRRVGVLGLSVGAEAAVAVAQEHLCGEIRLADFDTLELSNLNRLQAGFDDVGCNKAVLAARRIAKIDPYLSVVVFERGVTAASLGAFLENLDLLVEECDSLVVKREVRAEARRRGLNVVYAADERGFLSVEPYACWPELAPFHGRPMPPQASREDFASPSDYFHALTEWLGGWEGISARSRDSLSRVGETLCGYPQLASEARNAAGQIGHVARRLLLGECMRPFVGQLDLAAILPTAT